jgi:hypothetical protein
VKVNESEFLETHRDCWAARRAQEFSVVNIHAAEIPAPPARIFSELSAPELLLPRWHWKFLFGVRAAAGKILGWDRGVERHRAEPLEPGKHYAFFRIEHVDAPHEAGMSVENRLTKAQMS